MDQSITDIVPPARTEVASRGRRHLRSGLPLTPTGFILLESEQAAAQGLIWDYWERFFAAFSENLSSCSITKVDMRGVVLAWRGTEASAKSSSILIHSVLFFFSNRITMHTTSMLLLSNALMSSLAATQRCTLFIFIMREITLLTF
ncbi:hypothetical protein LINPERPRIM_LOCUS26652 [Linum perenne]